MRRGVPERQRYKSNTIVDSMRRFSSPLSGSLALDLIPIRDDRCCTSCLSILSSIMGSGIRPVKPSSNNYVKQPLFFGSNS
jgi:hypothetical protein